MSCTVGKLELSRRASSGKEKKDLRLFLLGHTRFHTLACNFCQRNTLFSYLMVLQGSAVRGKIIFIPAKPQTFENPIKMKILASIVSGAEC